MKHNLYSIKDIKMNQFGNIITDINDATITRSISQALKESGNLPIQKYPADHDLYHVGDFDTDTGKITIIDPVFKLNLSCLMIGTSI